MFKISFYQFLYKSMAALLVLAFALGTAGVPVARAAGFSVSNLNDSGPGSLRQAILDANGTPGADSITFEVSGTITLASTLNFYDGDGLTIDGSGQSITISGNNAVRVMWVNDGAALTLNHLAIADGRASGAYNAYNVHNDAGGGILNSGGTLVVEDSTFSGNSASFGGGIFSDNSGFWGLGTGTTTVTNSTFSGDSASYGGGIFSFSLGALTVTDSTFSGNSAVGSDNSAGFGGGIYIYNSIYSGSDTVENSTFSGNSAGFGGGIYMDTGTLHVTESTFSGNSTNGAYIDGGYGGGIGMGDSTVMVENSTFSGNSAGVGGGIMNFGSVVTVTDSTFSGNSVNGPYGGGGIANFYTLTVENSTLSGNSALYGAGGIFSDNFGPGILRNTIVANNGAGTNCGGTIVDGGGNLVWGDSTCPGINADPKLLPLADNGGPTQTMALGAGSAAIDAAVLTNCPPADQRGVSRPQGAGCDIGAFELEPQAPFNFSGFFQPVDNLPTLNTVKAGQGVPVKFSLGGDQGLDIFAAGYPVSQQITCDSSAALDAIDQTVAAGGSSLSYDPATDTYTYVWKTESSWKNTCRQLIVKLSDGTEHMANFKFK